MELPRVCNFWSTPAVPPAQQGLVATEARVDEPTHEHRLRGCQEEEAAGGLDAAPRMPDGMRFWHVIARAAVGRQNLVSLCGVEATSLGIIVCFGCNLVGFLLQLVMLQCIQAPAFSFVHLPNARFAVSNCHETCALPRHGWTERLSRQPSPTIRTKSSIVVKTMWAPDAELLPVSNIDADDSESGASSLDTSKPPSPLCEAARMAALKKLRHKLTTLSSSATSESGGGNHKPPVLAFERWLARYALRRDEEVGDSDDDGEETSSSPNDPLIPSDGFIDNAFQMSKGRLGRLDPSSVMAISTQPRAHSRQTHPLCQKQWT